MQHGEKDANRTWNWCAKLIDGQYATLPAGINFWAAWADGAVLVYLKSSADLQLFKLCTADQGVYYEIYQHNPQKLQWEKYE